MKKRNCGFVLPLVILMVGVVFLYCSLTQYSFMDKGVPGDGFFPSLMAIMVIITSLFSAITAIRAQEKEESSEAKTMDISFVVPILMILSIWAVAKLVGTFAAIFLVLFWWFKIFEKQKPVFSLLISLGSTAVFYFIFKWWIGISFESGLLFSLF